MSKKEDNYGIDFVKIEDGEMVDTIYVSRSPAIKAFINTSNMGPNAHAGQDFGWRLGPVWYKKLTEARNNPTLLLGLGVTDDIDDSLLLMKLWNAEVRAARNRSAKGSVHNGDGFRELINKAVAQQAKDESPVESDVALDIAEEFEPTHVQVKDESEVTKVAVKNTSNKKK